MNINERDVATLDQSQRRSVYQVDMDAIFDEWMASRNFPILQQQLHKKYDYENNTNGTLRSK